METVLESAPIMELTHFSVGKGASNGTRQNFRVTKVAKSVYGQAAGQVEVTPHP